MIQQHVNIAMTSQILESVARALVRNSLQGHVTHMMVEAVDVTPQALQPGPSRLDDFNTQRKASRAIALAFQCLLIGHVTGACHVNKAESRRLQAGDLELLGLLPGLEHLIGIPYSVCTKCVNRVKHLRQKALRGAGQENVQPQEPDLAAEVADLRKKLEKAEGRAKKAAKESKALKRKMSGSSKNGEQMPSIKSFNCDLQAGMTTRRRALESGSNRMWRARLNVLFSVITLTK